MRILLLIVALVAAALAAGCGSDSDPEVSTRDGPMKLSEIATGLAGDFMHLYRLGDLRAPTPSELDGIRNVCLWSDIGDIKGEAALLIDQACRAFSAGDYWRAAQLCRDAAHY